MHILEIIAKKRDNKELSNEEIKFFVDSYTDGLIPDYQASALLMAIYLNGMSKRESISLALAMRDSGDVLNLDDVGGIKVDKHSTGGVGDKVSLILGPLLAYKGLVFAKMSGRGLGHTGGTIDKLEAIPGFKTSLSIASFKKQLKEIGLAIIGSTGTIAPADKKLYALRDVTETVSCIPLIASSIMSKKLSSGADSICLDVKVGSGAFMKTEKDAEKLAKLMIEIGSSCNKNMSAILTDMSVPLGKNIGNSLEVIEAIETLKGNGPSDLVEVVLQIAANLAYSSSLYVSLKEAYSDLSEILANGKALNKFIQMVEAQGGDIKYILHPELFTKDIKIDYVYATSSGVIEKMDALSFGIAARYLGAGREKINDKLLLDVGLIIEKKVGDKVNTGDVICKIYHHDKGLSEAIDIIEKAITIKKKASKIKLIKKIL